MLQAAAAPYVRVKQYLKDGLVSGRWAPGALMPSEAELVSRFGLSRMTVSRAIRELQTEGLVERAQGLGTFAAPLHRVASTLTLRDLHDEIASRGQQHSTRVQLQRAERAPAALAGQLGMERGGRVFHTLILHLCDGVPLQCEDRYVNPAAAPDYLAQDFGRITPARYLQGVAPLWQAQDTIAAGTPTAQEAALLGIDAGAPCLVLVRRSASRGTAITLARLVHPGSRYAIEGSYSP